MRKTGMCLAAILGILLAGGGAHAQRERLDNFSIPDLKEKVFGEEEPAVHPPAQKPKVSATEDKASYHRRIERRLDWLDGRIHQLKLDAANKGVASKERLDRELPALERERHDAERKLDQLEVSTGNAWKTLRSDVDVAVGKVERTLNRVGSAI